MMLKHIFFKLQQKGTTISMSFLNKRKSMIGSTQYSILCNADIIRNEMSNIDKDSALTTHCARLHS